MAKYAKYTKVTIKDTKIHIERLLENWGIEEFFFGTSPRGAGIGFKYKDRTYKLSVPVSNDMPDREKRQMWRIFYMSLKMELEKIDAGLITFEDQFLSQMALPDGSTVSDFMKLPENLSLLQSSKMPKMLTS
jgi:hypothetical protein